MALYRGNSRKLIASLGAVLVLFVLVHQLSYVDYYTLVGHISASTELIQACPRPNRPKHKTSHDARQAVAGRNIPNIVHQIWKTADVRTYPAWSSRDSWRAGLEPFNYTVWLWTDDDIVGLIRAEYAWLLPTYEGYPQNIQRADVARLVVVHAHGGIYADLDVHPKSVQGVSCLQRLGLEAIFAPTSGALGLSNHFFMAERASPFLLWALHEAKRRGASTSRRIILPYLQVFWSTGPMMVTAASRDYDRARAATQPVLGVLDDEYGGTVVRHAAGRSWHRSDGRLFNYLGDHVHVEQPWVGFPLLVAALGLVCIMVRRRGWRWPASRPGKGVSF
ncbi:glycosyltransferase sugar-binding containing DXD motif domain-containing protein [Hirsutella rhossiliensis]|uniref:Glycosyltransferase sugar-binding containing DXD motif domain-containing protein n=1 Tax=Hirsutella rhossiliensis TaxID=111463 RepID=A0A9P8N7J4_9HYPO|nr:glycosyltransferase sugar-binding containing DXD motif domain-containing protein [Hirsutella rhossiliensis]KAH0968432.1 glycosyltransferase sugar-binding containing DXD motif domain-containing protein [Hirsutella rhossiliensis]